MRRTILRVARLRFAIARVNRIRACKYFTGQRLSNQGNLCIVAKNPRILSLKTKSDIVGTIRIKVIRNRLDNVWCLPYSESHG